MPTDNELLLELRDLTKELIRVTIQAPRHSQKYALDQVRVWLIEQFNPGTPIQGPDMPIPPGYSVLVRMRPQAGTPIGYVAGSEGTVRDSYSRVHLQEGESITVFVTNLKYLWFDADTAATQMEIVCSL